ncbi:MAG: hypothetical protein WDW38_009552 [Sanguina aurantia]
MSSVIAYTLANSSSPLLADGVNPLSSFSTIEANNSYLLVNGSNDYQAVRVLLVENNTLCFTAGRTAFYRSYIGLERNNWLSTLSTTLTLNDSRVNISDFFSWWVAESLQHIDARTPWGFVKGHIQESVVVANYSVLEFKNAVVRLDYSNFTIINSTFLSYSDGITPFPGNASAPAAGLYLQDSTLSIIGSDFILTNLSDAYFVNSTVQAINSTLRLFGNTKLVLHNSVLSLSGSKIILYDNSTVVLKCHSYSDQDAYVSGGPSANASLPVGQVLGIGNITFSSVMSTTLLLKPGNSSHGNGTMS